jgi:hypothetical protein
MVKEFGILSELSMMNISQWIAKENQYQPCDFPETDPAQYFSNHLGIERLSKPYPVDESYPETRLVFSSLSRVFKQSISSHRNNLQAHLRSTLLSRVFVSDLTLHANSVQHPNWTSRHSLLTSNPTLGKPLNSAYPLCISLAWFILLHSKDISSCLNAFNLWLPAHRVSILRTLYFWVQAWLIPLGPSKYLKLCLIGMWRLVLNCHNSHTWCQPIRWRKVTTPHLP